MKNKFQDDHHPQSVPSSNDTEQRIQMYRKAWLGGRLHVDSKRLAEKMIDFEKQIEGTIPDPSNPGSIRNRQ